jgi:hypothetical protein
MVTATATKEQAAVTATTTKDRLPATTPTGIRLKNRMVILWLGKGCLVVWLPVVWLSPLPGTFESDGERKVAGRERVSDVVGCHWWI